jgi:light-regulated signal transduction histidine kinase (bacteriophytochrome)
LQIIFFLLFIALKAPAYADYCSANLTPQSSAKIAELIGIAYYELRAEALQNAFEHKRITRQQHIQLFKNLKTLIFLHKNEIRKGKLSHMVVQHQRPHHLRLLKLEPHFSQRHHISLCYDDSSDTGRCSIYKKELSASSLQSYYSNLSSA